jgi:hypothetical protein
VIARALHRCPFMSFYRVRGEDSVTKFQGSSKADEGWALSRSSLSFEVPVD